MCIPLFFLIMPFYLEIIEILFIVWERIFFSGYLHKLNFFFNVYMFCLHACKYTYSCNAHRNQKMAPDPLKVELQLITKLWEGILIKAWIRRTEGSGMKKESSSIVYMCLYVHVCIVILCGYWTQRERTGKGGQIKVCKKTSLLTPNEYTFTSCITRTPQI